MCECLAVIINNKLKGWELVVLHSKLIQWERMPDFCSPSPQLEAVFHQVYKLRSKLVSYRQPYSTPTAQPSPDPHSKPSLPEGEGVEEANVSGVQPRGEGLNDSTETIDLDRDRRDSDGTCLFFATYPPSWT